MSKISTDLEQSQKLVELGLDPTTADMHTELIDVNGDMVSQLMEGHGDENQRNFGSLHWSLSALLDFLPIRVISNNVEYVLDIYPTGIFSTHSATSKWIIEYKGYTFVETNHRSQKTYMMLKSFQTDSLTNAAFNMVVWLIDNGFLKNSVK